MNLFGRTPQQRVARAGFLVLIGLVVVLATLIRIHTLSFVAFATAGMVPLVAGILFYLSALFRGRFVERERDEGTFH